MPTAERDAPTYYFCKIVAENCMKMKLIGYGPRGAFLVSPLDPPFTYLPDQLSPIINTSKWNNRF